MKLRSAARSDIGRLRRENEDRFLHEVALRAYGVADGVGGLPGGAKAAAATVELLREHLARAPVDRAEELIPLVQQINGRVFALGLEISPAIGIGTTLTFGLCTAGKLLLAHVGDSRCYRWSKHRLVCLTEDHSVENEARHRQARGERVRYPDQYRNALTRCIGQPGEPEVDTSEHELSAGDLLLFVTDGVTRVLTESEMAEIISASGTLDDRLEALIDRTNERGGPDNATAVLVEVEAIS